MLDRYGRVINYLRISVTDRCNLRCCYCMPEGVQDVGMKNILTFEEIREIVRTGVSLGITHIRITGGEPLVRKGCVDLIRGIREIPGVETITMTTNGVLLGNYGKQLKEAGVSMYHENIETSEENFPNVCTTHSFEDKIHEIKRIQEAGLELCTGGIVGMGETWKDRLSMAFTLAELGIRSIPINILIPVKGTPFGELEPMTQEDILRTVAILRYINPKADVRIAAGRNYFKDGGGELFLSGVNAALTGNLLTTGGSSMEQDRNILEEKGYILKKKPTGK